MARLKELNAYERFIMTKLCGNQRIVDVLLNTDKFSESEFLHPPVPNDEIKFKNIFPYPYAPDVLAKATTFICYTVTVPFVKNKTFKEINVLFHVFSEQSLIVLDDTTRVNIIAEELDEMFNMEFGVGLGRASLYSVEQLFNLTDKYHGKTICYTNSDWNAPRKW